MWFKSHPGDKGFLRLKRIMGKSQGLQTYGRTRVPKRAQFQGWTFTVLEMPVPGDCHQKHQLRWNGAGWHLEDRLCIYHLFDTAETHLRDLNFLKTLFKIFKFINLWDKCAVKCFILLIFGLNKRLKIRVRVISTKC